MTNLKKIEKIFNKYVSHPSDENYVYTEVDSEALEEKLFSKSIDKTSDEYIVLLLIWYGLSNINAITDVIEWKKLS